MQNCRYQSSEYMKRGNRRGTSQTSYPITRPDTTVTPVCRIDRNNCDELSSMPLAMAYVPWQEWRRIMDADKGFCCGTIFEELNKPFRGTGGDCR